MRKLVSSAAFALLVLGLPACPGPTFIVQQYGGPVRPAESIAILRVNGDEPVRLLFLDGEDVAAPIVSDGRLHIEMLPGRHTLTARNGDDPRAPSGAVAFQAEPARVYRVSFVDDRPHVLEVSRGGDRPLADVTLPPMPPAPAAPAPSAAPMPAPAPAEAVPEPPATEPPPTPPSPVEDAGAGQ